MAKFFVGDFEAATWGGGYPVWCELSHNGDTLKFRHEELLDVKHAVERMIRDARNALPDAYKVEV